MWFNILKIEGRRAAYRFYVNSLVHQGEFRPPKTPPTKNDEDPNDPFYIFESKNGHLKWGVRYDWEKLNSFGLIEMPDFVEPFRAYIEGMFENEYPEQYAALQDFFKENAPPTEERVDSDSPSPKENTIRRIMLDWSYYMDTINLFIADTVKSPRHARLLLRDINTDIPYEEVRDNIYTRFGPQPNNFPLATIRAIQTIYGNTLQRRNFGLIWENFINFIVPFREEYLLLISKIMNNQEIPDNYNQAMMMWEDAVLKVTDEQMRDLANNIWTNNPNDADMLVRQLPNYN